jgi:hypothetical protein
LGSRQATFSNVVLDTGSGTTIFKTDHMLDLGIELLMTDHVRQVTGIGGAQGVIEKYVDAVQVDDMVVQPMLIEVGELVFDFSLHGILGLDFLLKVKAQLDFDQLTITRKP